MKLELHSRRPATRAVEALQHEVESDEFDIRRLLLERKLSIRQAFQFWVEKVESDSRVGLGILEKIADLLMVDQVTQGQLLPSNVKQHVLMKMKEKVPFLTDQAVTSLISGHFDCLEYGAWAQLFPEEADFVYLEDGDVRLAIRNATDAPPNILSLETWMVCLMQVRPDRQADFRQVVSVESFVNSRWLERDEELSSVQGSYRFLDALASLYIIHPEARQQLVLNAQEKRSLLKSVRQFQGGPGFESFLRNATIVLADEAEVKLNGQIDIRFQPKAVSGQQRLPERDHA